MESLRILFVSFHTMAVKASLTYLLRHPVASHKSNPSSASQGTVDSYSTLPWVTWEAVTVVEGIS
jgi:hypothetical protein